MCFEELEGVLKQECYPSRMEDDKGHAEVEGGVRAERCKQYGTWLYSYDHKTLHGTKDGNEHADA